VKNDPASFVQLFPKYSGEPNKEQARYVMSVDDYRAYRAGARSLSSLAAVRGIDATLNDDPNPFRRRW
jgi:hypothetical protein